jgi:hypothetical protein
MTNALPDFTAIGVDQSIAAKIRAGFQPTAGMLRMHQIPFLDAGAMLKFIISGNDVVAVGKLLYPTEEINLSNCKQQAVKVLRVFND